MNLKRLRYNYLQRFIPTPLERITHAAIWVLALFIVAICFPTTHFFHDIHAYLPTHLVLEFVAISICVMIFTLGWNVRNQLETGYLPILGSVFLAVAIIDMMHTLSYPGMPTFITENTPSKPIHFWLFARTISAFSLLPLALYPRFRNPTQFFASGSLLLSLAYTGMVAYLVIYHADWLPATFSPDTGLTTYKIVYEYCLLAAYFLSATLFLRFFISSQDITFGWLALGTGTLGLSEIFFANYHTLFDQFAVTGHVFKVLGYLMIYRGLFVAGVLKPYVELAAVKVEIEAALNDSLISAIAFNVQEGIMITDARHIILRTNHAFTEFTGLSAAEVLGQHSDILNSERNSRKFYRDRNATLARDGFWSGEVWDKRQDIGLYPKWMKISAIVDAHGLVSHYVTSFSDISKFKEAENSIDQLANYDPLTRLPNRRMLLDRLKHAVILTARNHNHGAVLFIDIDHFKEVNDIRGHEFGDLILFEVATRIKACVRDGDTVARLGADEFIVVLESLDTVKELAAMQVKQAAAKICEHIGQPYCFQALNFHCTASIGINLFQGDECTVDDLLIRASTAMKQAKIAGRNSYYFFDLQMQYVLATQSLLESDLQQALAQQEFQLYYQRQVDEAGHVIGAEALIRWLHPTRGLVSPVEFIPLTEKNGLILPIGDFVLHTACRQLALWQAESATSKLVISVNVSAKQFRQTDFVDTVRHSLTSTGAMPTLLKLELTESVVVDNLEDTIAKMHVLKALGIGFSMDDFGTGYSSLSQIKLLPLDQLKIDQSFVRNLKLGSSDAIIVKTIIAMANALNLNVIAEGVETPAQLKLLRKYNCLNYQGYLFGRPLPIEQFQASLYTACALDDGQ